MSEAGEDPQRPHPVEVEKWPLVLLMPDIGPCCSCCHLVALLLWDDGSYHLSGSAFRLLFYTKEQNSPVGCIISVPPLNPL